ncbi:DUF1080 domain-containing protein [Bacteroides sp. OttesenSCG-928-J23]|nr:DUF1080 domain-containing protein [Bacteroides sp. OttesenSCG-928-J23]
MKHQSLFTIAIMGVVLLGLSGCNQKEIINLINGDDLSNWEFVVQNNSVPADEVYLANNGVVHVKGAPLGYMYTKEKYSNYKLHVEWRWVEGESNSGIFLLIENPKNPFPDGIECQLAAGRAGDLVLLGNSNLEEFVVPAGEERPAFPIVRKKGPACEKPAGEWNEADITVQNGAITILVNGEYQNTGTNKITTGHIGLQSEGKAVQFRNVTLEKL